MRIKLLNAKKPTVIHVQSLKKGQIAAVINWSVPCYIGLIVQRCGDTLFAIGKENCYWDLNDKTLASECQVRLLESGETIEIVEN